MAKTGFSNYAYLIGNICQNPKEYTTAAGKKFQYFDLAVHDKTGEKDLVIFISVRLWKRCYSLKKGDFMKMAGPLGQMESKKGAKFVMNCRNFQRLAKAPSREAEA